MQCNRKIYIFFQIVFMSACAHAGSVNNDEEFARAMKYYNSGENEKARAIVDQHYKPNDNGFALLSGLLHVREGRCNDALRVTSYINNYYDTHNDEVGDRGDTQKIYKYLKEINIYCHRELENWGEVEKEINTLLGLANNNNERIALLTNLGDAYANHVNAGMHEAVSIYESVLEFKGMQGAADTGDLDIREAALFKVIGLYVYEDRKDEALRGAVQLIKSSPHASHWINRMRASKWHTWLLRQQEVLNVIEEINH